jgi:FkbM family methyltransferase
MARIISNFLFILNHPLNRSRRYSTILNFLRWQLGIRILRGRFLMNWVNSSQLIVGRGEAGLTGNIYSGLLELDDMAFLLHYLRKDDIFFDIGANAGVYTVLASKVIGAKSIAFEPIEETFDRLIDQININKINDKVEAINCGVGDKEGVLVFTNNADCMNRVCSEVTGMNESEVRVATLDSMFNPIVNCMVKIDVEGFEAKVLDGGGIFFKNPYVKALIIEINGSGIEFGMSDEQLDSLVRSFGFKSIAYNPFTREIIETDRSNRSGNTIYLKDVYLAQEKCKRAKKVLIHTAGGVEI